MASVYRKNLRMKSILDEFHEVMLVSLVEDQTGLTCRVMPMMVGPGSRVVEDPKEGIVEVRMGPVEGYLVVPEVVQAGLGLTYLDESTISEVAPSALLESLGFTASLKARRHVVLRTSHQFVNIFVDVDDSADLAETITAAVRTAVGHN